MRARPRTVYLLSKYRQYVHLLSKYVNPWERAWPRRPRGAEATRIAPSPDSGPDRGRGGGDRRRAWGRRGHHARGGVAGSAWRRCRSTTTSRTRTTSSTAWSISWSSSSTCPTTLTTGARRCAAERSRRARGLRPPPVGAGAPRLARVERTVRPALLRLGARHAGARPASRWRTRRARSRCSTATSTASASQQLNFSAEGDAPPEDRAEAMLALHPRRDSTRTCTGWRRTRWQHGYDAEADFEFGLGILIDGLERVLDGSSTGLAECPRRRRAALSRRDVALCSSRQIHARTPTNSTMKLPPTQTHFTTVTGEASVAAITASLGYRSMTIEVKTFSE